MSDKQSNDTGRNDKDALLKRARDVFSRCKDASDDNHRTAIEDIRFARLSEQWPAEVEKQRKDDNRPCLTINRLPTFIRQVVNDSRQNKPSIKVHPADSGADKETAEVINGLIRNIEYTSDADVAYDTAVECTASGGFGYWRINLDYAYDDTFDLDIKIERIANPLAVFEDPNAMAADSSDWNDCFITDVLSKQQFKARYPKADSRHWDDTDAWNDAPDWQDDGIVIAEWWTREEVERVIYQMANGTALTEDDLAEPDIQTQLDAGVLDFKRDAQRQPVSRTVKSHKVTQRIMTGLEILETNDWPGRYIPIVPVYGDEIVVKGKRHFRSLVHDAIDAQRMFNYWRTTSTELVALAPRVPFIGPEGAFDVDPDKWATINTRSHAFVEYSKNAVSPPQRQPLDAGPAAGAMQEALLASDDMKGIMGLYDASLGAKSNETSGRAIMARQREGDVSTFHFIDNLRRAIRHTGRIIIDLIPHVYSTERVIRVLGEDGKEQAKPINQPYPVTDPKTGQPVMQVVTGPDGNPIEQAVVAMHDLTAGKYDLTVTTGPSFTTRREEAAYSMTEALRAFPAGAPVIVPELAKNLDWPGADKIAEKLEALTGGQVPPQLQQQIEEGKKLIAKLQEENQQLKADQQTKMAEIEADAAAKRQAANIDAETEIIVANIKAAAQKEIERFKAVTQAQASVAAAANRPAPQPRQ